MKIDLSKLENIELDGIDHRDYPDYVDAFISSATYEGKELTDQELDYINDNERDFVYELVIDYIY